MIAGRYSLEGEIGRGGMGTVWRAEDEVLGRTVALKRVGMSPGGASPDLRRAEREARLAARLYHPHVVGVFDLVNEGDEQWLVMEYVESRTLAELVRDEGPLPPDRAAALLVQAADALTAAHGAGIVHRDVKPSNILVTPTGQVKLTDFGIARAKADPTLTRTGMVTGSPAYLAPEVAAGEPATTSSDVWSLGATMFHALEGRPPYDTSGNVVGTLYQIVHEDPPTAHRAGWLAPLLASTMAKDPASRLPMNAVRDALVGGPAAAPVPPPTPATPSTPATPPMPPQAAPDRTQVLTAPVTAPPGTQDAPTRTAESPAQPPDGPPTRRTRSRYAWLLPLAGILTLVAVLVLGWALLASNGGSGTQADGHAGPAKGSSSESSSASPSASPSATPSQDATAAGEESMSTFVKNYLATVTSDPHSAWQRLTPAFQQQSGGYDSYRGFWSTISSAAVRDVSADPGSMTVTYDVTYTKRDGGSESDSVTLQLVKADDGYMIAGES